MDINYEIDNDLPAPMSFNVSTNTIKFNYLKVNGYKAKVNPKVKETDENFIKLLLYRQIGYYLDFKNKRHDLRTLMYGDKREKRQLRAKIDKNAWEYGKTLVPENLLNAYDKIRELDNQLLKD
ncbi:hypothetical protein [Pseudalkalibacillus caeni]|uniref:hypothetical protein n=1 Tax=Exobacillus caeni TaxID=2574798 RepID=UPI00319DA854